MAWCETYCRLKAAAEPFVMATLVEVSGSSPREAGARLIIRRSGEAVGTIGGGAMEAAVIEAAAGLFEAEGTRLLDFTLKEGGCGGRVKIFLEKVAPERELLIFGGGNVGHALARVMAGSSFAVRVVEASAQTLERFVPPEGTGLVRQDPLEAAEALAGSGERTHIVIAGYSHEVDEALLLILAEKPFRYLGVLGSATKAKRIEKLLRERGIPEAKRARIHCPAGLPGVGGKQPQEVAVSIAAQLLGL